MKLTEEHHKWMGESTPLEGTSAEKAQWICGAEEAIEKFGGIQWNKYPETKPELEGEYLAISRATIFVAKYNPNTEEKWSVLVPSSEILGASVRVPLIMVTDWAHINLPNQ